MSILISFKNKIKYTNGKIIQISHVPVKCKSLDELWTIIENAPNEIKQIKE